MSSNFPTELVKEGNVRIMVPKLESFLKETGEYAPSKAPVFYNPIMELNRDFAVLALQTHQKIVKREVVACEPLAGCGVRGIRLASEVEDVRKVIVNDISPEAARLAEFNVKLNNVDALVAVANEDANLVLSRYAAPRRRFDYVDIDPFGSPVPYLDSALRAVRNHGLLALTATDLAPLCGVHPKACLRKYGGKPLRTEYCHELAVRLLLGCLVSQAAKHDVGISPLCSYSIHNHVRAYATVGYGAKQADDSVRNLGYVLHCFQCFHREIKTDITPLFKLSCPECGGKLQLAGPLWLGSLWDVEFCTRLRNEAKGSSLRNESRMLKLVSLWLKEAEAPITYYVIDRVCDRFNLRIPSLSRIIEHLQGLGFEAVPTHFSSKAVRTDAPASEVREAAAQLSGSGSEVQESNIR